MNAVNILLFVLILLRLWIGLALFNSARKNGVPSLYWLALLFLANVVALSFAPTAGNPLGDLPDKISLWLFNGTLVVLAWTLAVFVHTSFYVDKQSPFAGILGTYLILAVVALYGVGISASNIQQSPWVSAGNLITLGLWAWHGWAAWQAYQEVARERTVEDWVKARYGMMVAYSVVAVIGAAGSITRVVLAGGTSANALGNGMALVTLVCQILSVSLQFLVWVMPERFRGWLNRNYKPVVATGPAMSEEELMQSLMKDQA